MDLGDAEVVVVGGGPAGATAAAYLAAAGIDVLLLEKSTFPRDKACGDGLTPRAVRELDRLGVVRDSSWLRTCGLRVFGGGHRLELLWPDGGAYPSYGLTKPRAELDAALLAHARAAGARVVEGAQVTGPVTDRSGRVTGLTVRVPLAAPHGIFSLHCATGKSPAGTPRSENSARPHTFQQQRQLDDPVAPAAGATQQVRAGIVLAADGAAARLGLALGRRQRKDRPLGVAARTYFRSRREPDPAGSYMESHLELWTGRPGQSELLPGYGWVFPLADGRINVGAGAVGSGGSARAVNSRRILGAWLPHVPGTPLDPADQLAGPASAALPMGFNRRPLYADGLVLLGDAAGLVSPFNGEGIGQAMASGRIAAEVVASALAARTAPGREQALRDYRRALGADFGGYFTLGRVFVELIGHPTVMGVCTRYGLGRPVLMRFTMKLLSGLYEPRGGDWMDRLIQGLVRMAPAA
ncbi:MAG: FAD-dependent monooxygenase [Bifidobacteriaceae bacterium]|jgi:flavin-dependent dehydrogenase|nr:FAD-dependent monooxygenase [Bifidobacteriaceae bacterium]